MARLLALGLAFAACACTKQAASQAASTKTAAKPAAAPKPAPAPETKRIRRAQVAGSWYPGDGKRLAADLDRIFADTKPPKLDGKVMALISPHAGYRFSGKAAATGYALVRGQDVRRVIVLAVPHRFPLRGASIPDVTHFETPLGLIPLDAAAVARLRRSALVGAVERAEDEEHSLEIQLPLLQRVLPSFTLVPMLVGDMREADYAELASVLAEIVDEQTLVVASSDFTHRGDNYGYEVPAGKGSVQERLARVDDASVERILKLDRRGLLAHAEKTGTTICGLRPIGLLLELLGKISGVRGQVTSRYTSGDVTGDWSSTVSYIDIAFTGKWPRASRLEAARAGGEKMFPLSQEERTTLLKLARTSLEMSVRKGSFDAEVKKAVPIVPSLSRKAGAFVTLKCKMGGDSRCQARGDDLRGCIGTIEPVDSVYDTVARRAASAALEDSRFPHTVGVAELPFVTIEISVLTPPVPVKGPEEIVIGKHGIILGVGWNSATFLPQVAPEQGWDRETTLRHLARKAGLPADAWKKAEYKVYEAIVFGEDEHR
ncbi:MAG: AmmeMemoRadiSam system protein B [Deltaproteobacteria bacterium]|nr:AmmeMemoRadiSam system protein B [Deltaproteobacteria bacterium]